MPPPGMTATPFGSFWTVTLSISTLWSSATSKIETVLLSGFATTRVLPSAVRASGWDEVAPLNRRTGAAEAEIEATVPKAMERRRPKTEDFHKAGTRSPVSYTHL